MDNVAALNSILGRVEERTLTKAGIRFKHMVFHDRTKTTIHAQDAVLSPVLMPIAQVMALVEPYRDAAMKSLRQDRSPCRSRCLPISNGARTHREDGGPGPRLFETKDAYYRRSSVERTMAAILQRAAAGGKMPPAGLRISKSVKRLGMTPVPWGAVIAAIVSGEAPICRCPGENRNWLTGVATSDIRKLVRAVRAELGAQGLLHRGRMGRQSGGRRIAGRDADRILEDRQRPPAHSQGGSRPTGTTTLIRRGRGRIERFAAKYMFAPRYSGAQEFDVPGLCVHGSMPAA